MINKRLLIKNILAFYDENSFYDKKRQLNLHTQQGKSKFLKHICALSNANPLNNSYLIIGVEDTDNSIIGVDFYDDSKIQNLINAYLLNPPSITYDNVAFDSLSKDKVVGLVTIRANKESASFKRGICDIAIGDFYYRVGSTSVPRLADINLGNKQIIDSIESNSHNDLKRTLDAVVNFISSSHRDLDPKYCVFKEQFVVCWAGNKHKVRATTFYSRVDIKFINEQVKLFYSDLDSVTIFYDKDRFVITEYLNLGLNDKTSLYPFEQVSIFFRDNGTYEIDYILLFQAPSYNIKILQHIYSSSLVVLKKIINSQRLSYKEERVLSKLCFNMMLCYLNGFDLAKEQLIEAKDYLKHHSEPMLYIGFKEVMRILRKLKYETQ